MSRLRFTSQVLLVAILCFAFSPMLAKPFIRGDSNSDGTVDLSDAVRTLVVLFLGDGLFVCEDAADADDNGALEVTDAVRTLAYLFLAEAQIPPPGPTTCGEDPTEDGLDCDDSSCDTPPRDIDIDPSIIKD